MSLSCSGFIGVQWPILGSDGFISVQYEFFIIIVKLKEDNYIPPTMIISLNPL